MSARTYFTMPGTAGFAPTILIVPHAGAGASIVNKLSSVEPVARVVAIQLSGRETRWREDPPRTLLAAALDTAEVILDLMSSSMDLIVVGDCSGAVIGVEALGLVGPEIASSTPMILVNRARPLLAESTVVTIPPEFENFPDLLLRYEELIESDSAITSGGPTTVSRDRRLVVLSAAGDEALAEAAWGDYGKSVRSVALPSPVNFIDDFPLILSLCLDEYRIREN